MRTKLEDDLNEILDDEWVRSQFYTPIDSGENTLKRVSTLRYQTTANTSVGGSGLGNSRVINPPPGFNKFADIPRGMGGDGIAEGSGIHYHENFEKAMDIVHFRPGVPRFNPLATFWTSAFNPDAMEAVEYGWVRKAASTVANIIGFIATAPIKLFGMVYKTLRSLMLGVNANRYSYYYLSPAPMLFWKGLDDMMMTFAIKLGVTGSARYSDNNINGEGILVDSIANTNMDDIADMMPGVMKKFTTLTGGYRIDTITIAHRYNLMQAARADYLKDKSKELFGKTFTSDKEYYNELALWEEALQKPYSELGTKESIEAKLAKIRETLNNINKFQKSESRYRTIMGSSNFSNAAQIRTNDLNQTIVNNVVKDTTETNQDIQKIIDFKAPEGGAEYPVYSEKADPGSLTEFQELYKSIAIGGVDFFSLAVDKIDNGSISVSNSVGPSNIESMFNGGVAAAKGAWFSAANGNIGDGMISNAIEGIVGTGKAFISGLADSVTGGVQTALFGGKAFIDVPDMYQGSSTTMPSMTYSFTSSAISGHPLSKLKMLFPVLAVLRVATPISAGPRSFMSPFLVAVTQKGRNVCNMGLITNVSIDWGGDAGWDVNDIPCEIKCSFTVTSLDKQFHIPLSSDLTDIYNDDSNYEAFANILAGVSPTDLDRSWAYNIKSNWAKKVATADRFFSASHLALAMGAGTRAIFEGPISALGGYVDWRE